MFVGLKIKRNVNNLVNAQQNKQPKDEKKKKDERKDNPREGIVNKLTKLFDTYLEDCVYFVRRKIK